MSAEEIPELLRKLHAELAKVSSLDPQSQQWLAVVANDLAKFESHVSTARRLAVRFEADHPAAAAVLRQLADALAKAGI